MTVPAIPSRTDTPSEIRCARPLKSALAQIPPVRPAELGAAFDRKRRARRVRFAEHAKSSPLQEPRIRGPLFGQTADPEAARPRERYEFVRVKPHACVSRPMALVGCLAGLVMGYGVGMSRVGLLTTGIGTAAAGTWAALLLVMLVTLPSYHRGRRLQPD